MALLTEQLEHRLKEDGVESQVSVDRFQRRHGFRRLIAEIANSPADHGPVFLFDGALVVLLVRSGAETTHVWGEVTKVSDVHIF